MSRQDHTLKLIALPIILGVAFLASVALLLKSSTLKKSDITLKIGEDKYVSFYVEKNELNFIDIINKILPDNTISIDSGEERIAQALLKTKDFYRVDDTSMIESLLKNVDYDAPVSKRLRELSDKAEGPWEERAKPVKISVPGGDSIPFGKAAVCRGSEFYRQNLLLFSNNMKRSISVEADSFFPCPNNKIKNVIQINSKDAKNLIGGKILEITEDSFAQIIPSNIQLIVASNPTRKNYFRR